MRRHVLAAGRYQQVLLAVGDAQKAVRIDLTDVPGGEPAIIKKHLRRRLRPLVVAPGDVRTARQDFAIVAEAQFHPRNRRPDGTEFEVVVPVGGQRRAGFRKPVALQDEQAGGVKELGDFPRQRSAAGDEVP